ncbi:hypothetical protein CsatA_010243 [Cannabis sativa]
MMILYGLTSMLNRTPLPWPFPFLLNRTPLFPAGGLFSIICIYISFTRCRKSLRTCNSNYNSRIKNCMYYFFSFVVFLDC